LFAGGASVPEIAPLEELVVAVGFEVEDGAEGRIGRARRLAVAEASRNRALVYGAVLVDSRQRAGPAGVGIVTGRACLRDRPARQAGVEEDEAAERLVTRQGDGSRNRGQEACGAGIDPRRLSATSECTGHQRDEEAEG
jgi:hypothetical protein